MSFRFLFSGRFWIFCLGAMLIVGAFFAWQLGFLNPIGLHGPARIPFTAQELVMSVLITLLLGFNAGLYAWKRHAGSCPRGTRRASGAATALGAAALLCPVCAAGSLPLFGAVIGLGFLTPFVPLLQIIALVLLTASAFLLLRA